MSILKYYIILFFLLVTIESVGILTSREIFKEAIKILKEKASTYSLNFE